MVTLIYQGRLYVANVGDARALLCRTDSDGVLQVLQLSQDHLPSNEDEALRLTTLGIAKEKIHSGFSSLPYINVLRKKIEIYFPNKFY